MAEWKEEATLAPSGPASTILELEPSSRLHMPCCDSHMPCCDPHMTDPSCRNGGADTAADDSPLGQCGSPGHSVLDALSAVTVRAGSSHASGVLMHGGVVNGSRGTG